MKLFYHFQLSLVLIIILLFFACQPQQGPQPSNSSNSNSNNPPSPVVTLLDTANKFVGTWFLDSITYYMAGVKVSTSITPLNGGPTFVNGGIEDQKVEFTNYPFGGSGNGNGVIPNYAQQIWYYNNSTNGIVNGWVLITRADGSSLTGILSNVPGFSGGILNISNSNVIVAESYSGVGPLDGSFYYWHK